MNIRDVLIGAGLALAGVALAQSVQRSLNLVVAGKPSSSKAVMIQNQTFVPLNVLGTLGIKSNLSGNTLTLFGATEGGANQIGAVEGCLGQDLFNGMIRFKVVGINRLETVGGDWGNLKGWAIASEFKNATKETLDFGDMGVVMASIVKANGSLMEANGTGIETRDWDKLRYNRVLPGASVNHIIKFIDNDSASDALPTKLIIQVDTKKVRPKISAKYTLPDPSFRIDLTCKK